MKDLRFSDHFLFTQYSLNTFSQCPLKFRKRYLENLKWDSFPDPEVKRRLETGRDFHLMAYRYFMGIDAGQEWAGDENPELPVWMERLREAFPLEPGVRYFPEYKLRMMSSTLKLEANFDLVRIRGEEMEIWDWKTHGADTGLRTGTLERTLRESLQTMVYLYVLKEEVSLLMGREVPCESLRMVYWQPDPPRVAAEIRHSAEQHGKYRQLLEEKVQGVLAYDYARFDKAQFSRHCRYCEFNWFCNQETVDFRVLLEEGAGLEELEWEKVEERF